ncbi:MAG: hypothetical protein AB7I48_05580 [Planctomycetaceae bacterium]
MAYPDDDPSEPCDESETAALLRDVQDHPERDDLEWLTTTGKVYAIVEAA